MKNLLRFICCGGQYWRDPLRKSSFSFCIREESPESGHWSHYLQLLSRSCLFCTVLQSVQETPLIPAVWCRRPVGVIPVFVIRPRKGRACCPILSRAFCEDLDI